MKTTCLTIKLLFFCLIGFLVSCRNSETGISQQTSESFVDEPTAIISPIVLPTKDNTSTPIPTDTLEIDDVLTIVKTPENIDISFNIEKNDSPPPISVLQHLKFTAGFGGGGSTCNRQEYWQERTLFWTWGGPKNSIFEFHELEIINVEWIQNIEFSLCGVEPNEVIKFSVISPNRSIYYQAEGVPMDFWETGGHASFHESLEFPFKTDPGNYTITFSGDAWELTRSINLLEPTTPRVYFLNTSDDDNKYFLYNFKPNENITLLIYSEDPSKQVFGVKKLFDWKQFQVDENGQLTIKLIFEFGNYWSPIFFGKSSREVHVFNELKASFDNHFVQTPETGLEFFLPTTSEIDDMRLVLSSAEFKDIKSPATINYNLVVLPDEKMNWLFRWCTKDYSLLDNNLDNMNVEFFLNDFKLDEGYISEKYFNPGDGPYCKPHNVFLRGWEKGKDYTLELRYIIDKDISDGTNTYKAGTYRHIFNVTVKD